jgi:hypothetical protein
MMQVVGNTRTAGGYQCSSIICIGIRASTLEHDILKKYITKKFLFKGILT